MLIVYGWLILLALAALYGLIHYSRYYLAHYRARKTLNDAHKKPASEQSRISYDVMQQIFALYRHPRPAGWTIQQYQAYLEQHFPELSREIRLISQELNIALYDDQTKIDSEPAGSSLQYAKTIVKHKFAIPHPAEKQLKMIMGLFRNFSSARTANENRQDLF